MLPRIFAVFFLILAAAGQDGLAQNPQVTLGTSVTNPNATDPIPVLALFDRPVSGLTPEVINVTGASVANFRQFAAATHSPGSRPTVALGSWHGVAVRPDGTLAAWGDNGFGQLSVPAGGGFTAVAAGMMHSLALRADGSVAAWGMDFLGQCTVPEGSFKAIAAGDNFSLGLRADGSLAAWGGNDNGECTVPAGNDFVAIAAGASHAVALRADGTVAAWGNNDLGQATAPAGNDFIAIDAGSNYSLAVRADGTLAAWGFNGSGLDAMPAGTNLALVEAGGAHGLGLDVDGTLSWWGEPAFTPVAPVTEKFMGLAGGACNSAALRPDGTLAIWGLDFFGINTPPAGLAVRQPLVAMALFDLLPNGQGAISAQVPAGACSDAAGLMSDASNLLSFSSGDTEGPEATITTCVSSPTNLLAIPVTITFNEPAVGFGIGDVTVVNGWALPVCSEADTVFKYVVIPKSEGTVSVSLSAGVCNDAAGNANSASGPLNVVFDVTPPWSRLFLSHWGGMTTFSALSMAAKKNGAGSSKIVALQLDATDNLSTVVTALYVLKPGSRKFVDTGLRVPGASGVFNYNFGDDKNGLYLFLTQATDAAGNVQKLGTRCEAVHYVYTGWRPAKKK